MKEAANLIHTCKNMNPASTPASVAGQINKEIQSLTKIIGEVRGRDSKRRFMADRRYWKVMLLAVERRSQEEETS